MKNLNLSIRDLIFSSKCSLCKERHCDKDPYLCYNCYEQLTGEINLRRRGNLYYTAYYSSTIKRLIGSFKLRNRRYLGELLGGLIRESLIRVIEEEEIQVVIPVPLSIKKERNRGYNQVEEILKAAGVPYTSIKRVKDTKPMHGLLDEELRRQNVFKGFESHLDAEGKNILIVDDIVTTGSTVRELVSTIEKNGKAGKIRVFAFALAKTAFVKELSFERE